MFELLAWLVCTLLFLLLWPIFAADRPSRVRPLSQDELGARWSYRLDDKAKVARLRFAREHARHLWDLNRKNAEAIRVWRRVPLFPRPAGPNED